MRSGSRPAACKDGYWSRRRSRPGRPEWRPGPRAEHDAGAGPGPCGSGRRRLSRSLSFPLLLICDGTICDGTVEHGVDEVLGVAAVGWRPGDQDPVVDRPDQLVDQDGMVNVAAKPFPVAGALQPGPRHGVPLRVLGADHVANVGLAARAAANSVRSRRRSPVSGIGTSPSIWAATAVTRWSLVGHRR